MNLLTIVQSSDCRTFIEEALSSLGPMGCQHAESLQAALRLAHVQPPSSMVVFDIDPWIEGDVYLQVIRQLSVHASVVAVSQSSAPERILRVLSAGAKGFVLKSGSNAQWLDTARQVVEGRTVVPSIDELPPPGAMAPAVVPPALDGLTRRQRQVLELLVQGRTNKAIASLLGIEESTVKSHVTVVLQALGVRNRTEAVYALNAMNGRGGAIGDGRP